MFSGLPAVQPKRWTTIFSFTVQAAIVSSALVLPLIYPRSLPEAFAHRRIFVPMHEGDAHPQPNHGVPHPGSTFHSTPLVVNQMQFVFRPNPDGPDNSNSAQPPAYNDVLGSAGGPPISIGDGGTIPKPRPPSLAPVRISRMMEGNLIHRIDPQYPAIAKQAGVQGMVVIKAIISREGTIEHEELVSGPALLTQAALQAVRQWKYRPYFLNSEPVEVETQITVNFVLNR